LTPQSVGSNWCVTRKRYARNMSSSTAFCALPSGVLFPGDGFLKDFFGGLQQSETRVLRPFIQKPVELWQSFRLHTEPVLRNFLIRWQANIQHYLHWKQFGPFWYKLNYLQGTNFATTKGFCWKARHIFLDHCNAMSQTTAEWTSGDCSPDSLSRPTDRISQWFSNFVTSRSTWTLCCSLQNTSRNRTLNQFSN
jgi:hypothetical protein